MQTQTLCQNKTSEDRTKAEIEDIIVMIRLRLYNRSLPCGAMEIRNYMASEYAIQPLPSERTIASFLSHRGLTNGRTGFYEE